MAATQNDIRLWLSQAKAKGAAYMLVVVDTFDYGDYPVYVLPGQDVRKRIEAYHDVNMQRVMEVYNLSLDTEQQVREARAWNI